MSRSTATEPNARDLQILRDLRRVRALTGRQIERLSFADLTTTNVRASARRRTMRRLCDAGLVTTLPRRVGGDRAGSAGLVYLLDRRGHELLQGRETRTRRPWPLGWPFVAHTLDVAELYVRLRELARDHVVELLEYETEPLCWYRTGQFTLKPDAFVVYEHDGWEQHRWIEVDRSTESLPTLARKLGSYLSLAAAGASGPLGVLPRVVVTVPDQRRRVAVASLLSEPAAANLICVELFQDTFTNDIRPPP